MSTPDSLKRDAAERAAELVRDGMKLGLGTGSTARHFVDFVGERVRRGARLICVPTSEETRRQAESLAIPLTTLDETPELDLTIDGADEIDGALNLVKGGGGAHLREKMVAASSRRLIVIADASKKVAMLGAFPLPIEVVRFGVESTRRRITAAAASVGCRGDLILRRRADGTDFITDEQHLILDAHFGRIPDPGMLALALTQVPGVVEHGLFIGLCAGVIVAGAAGVEVLGSLD
ncbi:ribose-5-phosphate isomerase RpiA [Terrarubrum flagellatum]|uniref:ribose-5-phosphate isomerase RpiA n=1 Tax=Terrirubrum flagellatum TaxID=2895980 RepID=UPI0031455558